MGRGLHQKHIKWIVVVNDEGIKRFNLYHTLKDISEDLKLTTNKIYYLRNGSKKHESYRNKHIVELLERFKIFKIKNSLEIKDIIEENLL